MAEGYTTLIPIRKTVIKDSTIDFRFWRNREGIGPSYVSFNGANIESSYIYCTSFASSISPLNLTPVRLYFDNLTLDRSRILMNGLNLTRSGSFTLDFYGGTYQEIKCASTFRNSRLRFTNLVTEDHTEFGIYGDYCNWNNSELRLDALTTSSSIADAGGVIRFVFNTTSNDSVIDFRYNDIYSDGNYPSYPTDIRIHGNHDDSTIFAPNSRFQTGIIKGGYLSIDGSFDHSSIYMAGQSITDYDITTYDLDFSYADLVFDNFSNGTTAGTYIHANAVTLDNSHLTINELVNTPTINIENVKLTDSSLLTIEDTNIPLCTVRTFYNYTSINDLVSIRVNSVVPGYESNVSLLSRSIPRGFVANKIAYGQNLFYDSGGDNFIYLLDANLLSTVAEVNVSGATFANLTVSQDLTASIIPGETAISFTYWNGSYRNYWSGLADTVVYSGGVTTITVMGSLFYATASLGETLTSGVKIHSKIQSGFSYLSGEEPTSLTKYLTTSTTDLAFCSSGSNATGTVDFILSGRIIA